MFSLSGINRAGIVVFAVLVAAFTCGISQRADAQTFTTSDQAFSFTYPQRWEAVDAGGVVKITAPDGSRYTLKLDTIETALTASSPLNDVGLKAAAAKIAAPLASGAAFVRASPIPMDHGSGASFHFKSTSGDPLDIWIGLIGKHSVVLTPAKAGQPGTLSIGLAVIFQSMPFADNLPKQPAQQPAKQQMADDTQSLAPPAKTRTILFSKQIAPILSQRCVACHSSQSAGGGLNASSYSAFLTGGSKGAIIKPNNVAGSTLIDYLTGAREQMPKGSAPLDAEQIDLFRTWIREGATNDLDPSSGRSASTSSASGSGTTQPARLRNNGAGAPGRAAGFTATGPKPMESYTGHLASNDTSFTMKLYTNGTVTADWEFDQPSPARFEGTYTNLTGVYTIKLGLTSGSIPGASKTLKLIMQANGTDVLGKFSLDATSPKYKIIALQLAEIDNASKNPNTQGGTGAAGGGSAGNGNNRRRRQQ